MPVHASQMYAKNLTNLLELFLAKDGSFALNLDDDIVAATCITHDGEIFHGPTRGKLGLGDRNAPAPPPAPETASAATPATEATSGDATDETVGNLAMSKPDFPEGEETISLATVEADISDAVGDPALPDIEAEDDEPLDLEWAPDVEERAASDYAGFVPPVSIGDTLPASREMLDQAVRDIEDEIASNDADLPTDEPPWRSRTE